MFLTSDCEICGIPLNDTEAIEHLDGATTCDAHADLYASRLTDMEAAGEEREAA